MRKKKDKTIKSILDLIKYLKKDVSDYDGPVWFVISNEKSPIGNEFDKKIQTKRHTVIKSKT